jgi:hypothetical protein
MDNGTALSLRASTPDRIAAGRIDHAVALSRHTAQPFSGLLLADGRGDTHLSVVWCNVQGDAEVTGTGRRAQLSGRSADGPQSRRHVWQSTATPGNPAAAGRARQQSASGYGAGYRRRNLAQSGRVCVRAGGRGTPDVSGQRRGLGQARHPGDRSARSGR